MSDVSVKTWNENNILTDGMEFIKTTQKELSTLEMIWRSSQNEGEGFWSDASIEAAREYRTYAKLASSPMAELNDVASKVLKNNKNSSETESLEKIVLCSDYGTKYLKRMSVPSSNLPDSLNKKVHEAWKNINHFFLAAVPVSVLLRTIDCVIPVLPANYTSPFQMLLPIWITACAIHHFASEKVIKPEQQGLENAKILFEHSIATT